MQPISRRLVTAVGAVAVAGVLVSPVGASGTTVYPAVAEVSCTGGTSYPNSFNAQWSWDGARWLIYLDGRVSPVALISSLTVQVYVYTASGHSQNIGTAGTDGSHYYWADPVTQDVLGLINPGDTSTFWLHFAIPAQPDRDTCSLRAVYSAPVGPAPTPVPTPVPTPRPVLTPAPTPLAVLTPAPTQPPIATAQAVEPATPDATVGENLTTDVTPDVPTVPAPGENTDSGLGTAPILLLGLIIGVLVSLLAVLLWLLWGQIRA